MPPSTRPSPIRIVINGATGRMGVRIAALAARDTRFDVVATCDSTCPAAQLDTALDVDVVVDFSTDDGARDAAVFADRASAALLVGTTGVSAGNLDVIDDVAERCAVVIAANTSLGVAVMTRLATEAARLLGPSFEPRMTETHHTAKRDAPSGTALRLAEAVTAAGRPIDPDQIESIRAGDVIGEHTIAFEGAAEMLSITHRAGTRDLFAGGALAIAAWLAERPAGRYSVDDALSV